ncbi:MAG: DUF4333 domain-containing protein [Nocardiaceae bacterium]|nr:DUF4333 domain-containing protein [Nocardiaceae bacterium]
MSYRKVRMKVGSSLVAAIALVGITGCSVQIPVVGKDSLENQVFERLAKEWGHNPQKVKCPAALRGEINQKQTCVVTDDGVDHMVTVTVVKVDGSNVDFKLDTGAALTSPTAQPEFFVGREDVARQVADQIVAQLGRPAEMVNCPNDLPAVVGATTTCYIHDGSDVWDAVVTVREVNGSNVNFDVQVAGEPR